VGPNLLSNFKFSILFFIISISFWISAIWLFNSLLNSIYCIPSSIAWSFPNNIQTFSLSTPLSKSIFNNLLFSIIDLILSPPLPIKNDTSFFSKLIICFLTCSILTTLSTFSFKLPWTLIETFSLLFWSQSPTLIWTWNLSCNPLILLYPAPTTIFTISPGISKSTLYWLD